MSPSVHTLVSIALLLLAGCVGTTAPPTLVLQLSQITRARVTERAHEERRELTMSAALSVGIEAVTTPLIDPHSLDPPNSAPDASSCEPNDSAICAWARAAEESAWLAVLEHAGLPP